MKGGSEKKEIMNSKLRSLLKNKKGQQAVGLVTGLIAAIGGLIVLVIVSFLIIDTLIGAGLLTAGGASDLAVNRLRANYTKGIDEVSAKIPTILLIAAVVVLFGAISLLVDRSRQLTQGGGL